MNSTSTKKMIAGVVAVLAILIAPALLSAHSFLCCDYYGNKVCVVSAAGKIEWEFACQNPQDCWRLANGNYLFTHLHGVLEVTQDKKIAWEYKAPAGVEIHSCQPIEDGRVLIVECGTSRVIEVGRDGRIAKEIKLTTSVKSVHDQFRCVRKAKNGHYFVCFKGEGKVQELDGAGKVLRNIAAPDGHAVVLLPEGHLLVNCGDNHRSIELDANGRVVWELREKDLPGHPLRLVAGAQRLPDGNTVICNDLGHGHFGEQPQVFELTRDKKIVWQFEDHARFKVINKIVLLDVAGEPMR